MSGKTWKRGGTDTRLEQAEKRDRQRVIAELRKLAGIRGRGDKPTENYLLQCARNVSRSEVDAAWRRWRRAQPRHYSAPARDRIRAFYYWLTEAQLSQHDAVLASAYFEVAESLGIPVQLERDEFRGYGDILFERLDEFIGDAGNEIEDVAIDYLLAIFRRAQEWKPAILSDPKVSLGRYGWKVWQEWITDKGGRRAYLRPSHEKLADEHRRRELVDELHDLKSEALAIGGVEMLDEIGRGAHGLDDEELREFIATWRERLANAGQGRRGSIT